MAGLGAELRRLREAKGATLEQVAAATKVGVHHLDALETDNLGALPGDVFVRGFVRAYADFLGAASEGLLALYHRDRAGLKPDVQPAAERTVQEMSRLLAGAPRRTVRRGGLSLRITLNQNLGSLALRIGAIAAVVAGVAALAIFMSGRRGVEADRSQMAGPLRASRRVTDAPPASSVPVPMAAAPTPALSSPSPSVPSPSSSPLAEIGGKPVDLHGREQGLEVSEHGVGSHVEGGRLSGRAAIFEEGAAVWFWTRVDGGQPGQMVRHVWLRGDREVHSVDLEVGSAQWRTWSRKTLRPGSAGIWSVEARDAYGRVLASDEFECRANR